jgi:hypothetical protein
LIVSPSHSFNIHGFHLSEDPEIQRYLEEHSLDHPSQILSNATAFLEDSETTVSSDL